MTCLELSVSIQKDLLSKLREKSFCSNYLPKRKNEVFFVYFDGKDKVEPRIKYDIKKKCDKIIYGNLFTVGTIEKCKENIFYYNRVCNRP